MKNLVLILVSFICGSMQTACMDDEGTRSSQPQITGGEFDDASKNKASGVFGFSLPGVFYCTATKVSESLYLTASHCFFDSKTKTRKLYFGAGTAIGLYDSYQLDTNDPANFTIEKIWLPPEFDFKTCPTCESYTRAFAEGLYPDIAFFKTRESVPLTEAPARTINTAFKDESSILLTQSGYGMESIEDPDVCTDGKGSKNFDIRHKKYIEALYQAPYDIGSTRHHNLIAMDTAEPKKASMCFGDSGGPLLNPDGEIIGVLGALGVYARAGEKESKLEISAFYARTGDFSGKTAAWIHQVLDEAKTETTDGEKPLKIIRRPSKTETETETTDGEKPLKIIRRPSKTEF